jgi:Peptidase family M1 domain
MKYLIFLLSITTLTLSAQKFSQLENTLPSPNSYRTASGAPGHEYWQQRADYNMKLEIDDNNQRLLGEETIKYYNNSPDALSYLWLQLDQNLFSKESNVHNMGTEKIEEKMAPNTLQKLNPTFDGGHKIEYVKDAAGNKLPYTINETMMRIDLAKPLKKGETFTFNIKWSYNISEVKVLRGRSGFERFDDGNMSYVIAQFFPRMCKYYDTYGWQNKQFMGRGEFTLEFGNYNVEITVPSDHIIAATGTLTNANNILTPTQIKRLAQAQNEFVQPVTIATKDEADQRIKEGKSTTKKTWKFSAENVRDFAFATSRRFIWDALNTKLPSGKTAMAMSMWTKEGDCLWSKYSTKAVAHTLKTYSKFTIDYPYPIAWSVDGDMGMEYPMICFNFGRCEADETYAERMKYGHIGVIIHEVGHNFFPMIINSDERQWTWMDEGLNTFVQGLAQNEWERTWPGGRGTPSSIVDYMKSDKKDLTPIMTNSESIKQFGNNAYAKPAAGLNILRETIMGRELFDKAFKEYATRWAFKTPTPADFFRTMEDASAIDLDWFWRGWFYNTDPVDLTLHQVKHYKVNPKDPNLKYDMAKSAKEETPKYIGDIRNQEQIKQTYNEADPSLNDFYNTYDKDQPDAISMSEYQTALSKMSDDEKAMMNNGKNYYEIAVENKGGLPMPIIIEMQYEDGTSEVKRIPVEVWRFEDSIVTKVFITDKPVKQFVLDPYLETADIDRESNYYPPKSIPSRFEVFKNQNQSRGGAPQVDNPMQRAKKAKEVKP